MSARNHLFAALTVSAVIATARVVDAQPRRPVVGTPAQPSAVTDARRAYDEGTAQYAAGHYPEALTAFRRAYELRSNPVVLLPIIECHRQLGQATEELATIEHYLHDAPNAPTREALEARAATLRPHPATWHVTSTPPGADITVDGQATHHAAPADIDLTPGQHIVSLSLDGYATIERQVDVTSAEAHPLEVTLTPVAPPHPPVVASGLPTPFVAPSITPEPTAAPAVGSETHHATGWTPVVVTTAIVAGAGFITSAIFGVLALGASNSYATAPTQSLYDSGRRDALFCDVGWIVGALATGVGVVVFLSSRAHHEDSTAPAQTAAAGFRLTPSGAGLTF